MVIYKLKDLLLSKPIYGANLAGKIKGKYKYFMQTDLKNSSPKMFVDEHQEKFMNKNDFFISRAGTIDTYIHENDEKYVYAGYLVKYPINEKLAISKYIYYWTKSIGKNQILSNSKTGSTMPKFNPPIALQLSINLPSIKIQKEIIDIIEPNENLFLNYSNCVRIDSIENTKKDIKKLIDIIEPLEKMINILNKIIIKIESNYKNIQLIQNRIIKIKNIIINFSNGFAYKKEDISKNGKYKIFKIKNIQNKNNFNLTNYFKNNLLNIGDVVTGLSGTIGSVQIIIEKNWVCNQRTMQIKSKYFLEIKSIIELNKKKLFQNAHGAAQKNISHKNILHLNISIKKYSQNISNFFLIINQKINILKKIQFLLIKTLIK